MSTVTKPAITALDYMTLKVMADATGETPVSVLNIALTILTTTAANLIAGRKFALVKGKDVADFPLHDVEDAMDQAENSIMVEIHERNGNQPDLWGACKAFGLPYRSAAIRYAIHLLRRIQVELARGGVIAYVDRPNHQREILHMEFFDKVLRADPYTLQQLRLEYEWVPANLPISTTHQ